MFNSLFGNFLGWIASVIDFILTWVLEMLSFNLSFFTTNFPVIDDMYVILQGVGIGLVVAIAAFQLYKYLTGPLSEVSTNPLEIGVRVIISFALIYFGNYFLEGVVNLFTYPYEALLNVDTVDMSNAAIMVTAANSMAAMMSGAPGTVLALMIIVPVAWNIVKLVLEVIERYLMIGVLTYTSPLAWSTISSKNTQSIFSKWMSMFLGQCLLMLLNVWSVKMLISILAAPDANTFFKFILALAFCKVAQRFDTYLNTLGISAAHTGGALLDELVAVGSTISGLGSKTAGNLLKGSGKDKALGEALTKNGWMGGAAYSIGSMFRGASDSERVKTGNNTGSNTSNGQGNNNTYGGGSTNTGSTTTNGFDFKDRNGVVWATGNEASRNTLQSKVESGYAKFAGESDIKQDGNGGYTWSDKDGNVHNATTLDGMLAKQNAVRADYENAIPLGKESEIHQNADGTYDWTDRNGNNYHADSMADMQQQQAMARSMYTDDKQGQETDIAKNPDGTYSWTDKHGNVNTANTLSEITGIREQTRATYGNEITGDTGSAISSLRNKDASMYASQMFNPNGTAKAGVVIQDATGRQVLAGGGNTEMANKIANISTPSAMTTGAGVDSVSSIKADTIASRGPEVAQALMKSNVSGGIVDQRVAGATFEQLFAGEGGAVAENGIDSVVPGLTNSVMSANGEYIEGSGDVSDMKMQNGEMSGTYIPVDGEGNEGTAKHFSIRDEESYSALSATEQGNYTKFEGTDGNTYYASSSEAQISDYNVSEDNISGTTLEGAGIQSPETSNYEANGVESVVSDYNVPNSDGGLVNSSENIAQSNIADGVTHSDGFSPNVESSQVGSVETTESGTVIPSSGDVFASQAVESQVSDYDIQPVVNNSGANVNIDSNPVNISGDSVSHETQIVNSEPEITPDYIGSVEENLMGENRRNDDSQVVDSKHSYTARDDRYHTNSPSAEIESYDTNSKHVNSSSGGKTNSGSNGKHNRKDRRGK